MDSTPLLTSAFARLASSAASLAFCFSFLSLSSSCKSVYASRLACSTTLSACDRAFSISCSRSEEISAFSFSASAFSLSAFSESCFARSYSCSIFCLVSSRRSTTFSNALFSLETSSLARLITSASSPSFSLIARAFDLPGTPISRR